MAAKRCVLHGSFPASMKFDFCPVCGERTDYINNIEPDEDWELAVIRQQEWLAKAAEQSPDIPVLESDVRVRFDGEHYWIHAWDVYGGGIHHRLKYTDLVQVGKQTFEVLKYSHDRREYLVRPFSTTLSDDELRQLADTPQ